MRIFKVRGKGPFPWDMLRYDTCYPVGSDAAAKLVCNADDAREPREIVLRTDSKLQPTYDRWASFLWFVTAVSCVDCFQLIERTRSAGNRCAGCQEHWEEMKKEEGSRL